MSTEQVTFTSEFYERARTIWKGHSRKRRRIAPVDESASRPYGVGRDPRSIDAVLSNLSQEFGWSMEIDRARIIADWPEFVGPATAAHTQVLGISKNVLEVQCDSTAWATELRRLRGELLNRLIAEYPDAELQDFKVLAPGAPSWRHGPRVVRGRGPRDTYG